MQRKVGIWFSVVAFATVIVAGMTRAIGAPEEVSLCLLIGSAVCIIIGAGLWSAHYVNKIKQTENEVKELKKEVKKLKGE